MNDRAPAPARSPRGLRALWRGALPLRFVFWVLNVAVHVVVNAALAGVEWWGERSLDEPGAIDLVVVVVIVLYAAYTVVAWVGLWRSAGRYPGRRLWRVLARLTVIGSVAVLGAMTAAEVFIPDAG